MRRLLGLIALCGLAACGAAFPVAPPTGALKPTTPADVHSWIASLRPTRYTTLRFYWVWNQDGGHGKGSIGIAPPDSLHLDYRAGMVTAGAGFVLGDSTMWAQPQEAVEKLVPSYELLWGMVGVARPPRKGWKVEGQKDGIRTAFRYTRGADTTEYVWWIRDGIGSLQTTVTLDGKRVARALAVLNAARQPIKSRLDVYSDPGRLDLTFYAGTPLVFDKDFWIAPRN